MKNARADFPVPADNAWESERAVRESEKAWEREEDGTEREGEWYRKLLCLCGRKVMEKWERVSESGTEKDRVCVSVCGREREIGR